MHHRTWSSPSSSILCRISSKFEFDFMSSVDRSLDCIERERKKKKWSVTFDFDRIVMLASHWLMFTFDHIYSFALLTFWWWSIWTMIPFTSFASSSSSPIIFLFIFLKVLLFYARMRWWAGSQQMTDKTHLQYIYKRQLNTNEPHDDGEQWAPIVGYMVRFRAIFFSSSVALTHTCHL